MINLFLILFMLTSCASYRSSSITSTQTISLKAKTLGSKTHHAAFDEFILNAPNFSVDQYHDGLRPYFHEKKDSYLCNPAALATALIQDLKSKPDARKLKLKSIKSEEEIDGNALVEELLECTKTNIVSGAKTANTADCIAGLYKDAGLNYEVKIIANWSKAGFAHIDKGINIVYEYPTTADIIKYLKEGYHIIGSIDMYVPDENLNWISKGGHVVNINGYARQKNWPKNLLYLYITDPDFNYGPSEFPRYHQALLSESKVTKNLPRWQNGLFLEGGTFMGLKQRAFLSGLLIFKIKS
ncbi:MAG TPA: hypothetical protein VNJ08_10850 [Bacteriovoracaceae bacterium]|nr:hypothetical protein [Bacteriovoracaceae bacterium]